MKNDLALGIDDRPILAFATSGKWRQWLARHHATSDGVWLRIFKRASNKKTVTYDEALDDALCFGWIDGQKNKYDEESWIQKFTPRRPKSIWSKRNKEHVARLIKEQRMTAAGLKQVNAAKLDGRWDNAYDSSKSMQVPAEFVKALQKDKRAYTFFQTLNKANTYAIAWRLQTAKKPATREKRMKAILDMLSRGMKFH